MEHEETLLQKEQEKVSKLKSDLEEEIMKQTSDTVICDKTIRHLNKLLLEAKDKNKDEESILCQVEQSYKKNLLRIERLISTVENAKLDLDEIVRENREKEKNLDKLMEEIKHNESSIAAKQRQILLLNKKIEEVF